MHLILTMMHDHQIAGLSTNQVIFPRIILFSVVGSCWATYYHCNFFQVCVRLRIVGVRSIYQVNFCGGCVGTCTCPLTSWKGLNEWMLEDVLIRRLGENKWVVEITERGSWIRCQWSGMCIYGIGPRPVWCGMGMLFFNWLQCLGSSPLPANLVFYSWMWSIQCLDQWSWCHMYGRDQSRST